MDSILRCFAFFFAAVLFLWGITDLANQYKAGLELEWRVPLVLILFGSGIPVFLVIFPDFGLSSQNDSDSSGDGDYGGFGDGGDGGGGD